MERLSEYWTPAVASLAFALFICALVLSIHLLARRGLRSAVRNGKLSKGAVVVLVPIVRWSLLIVLFLALMQHFGVLQQAWSTLTAIIAMVAIGFVAVWSVLSNALCTILLLVFKPFRIGDTVEMPAEGVSGRAVDINFAYTTLVDDSNNLIQIPNNFFFQKIIRKAPGRIRRELTDQLDRKMLDQDFLKEE